MEDGGCDQFQRTAQICQEMMRKTTKILERDTFGIKSTACSVSWISYGKASLMFLFPGDLVVTSIGI
jgi:hypothetical protein